MNIFIFDGATNTLKINEYEILLVKEFADLWDESRNKCKEDKNGKNRDHRREYRYKRNSETGEFSINNEYEKDFNHNANGF